MGLLLSILVACVGVVELFDFYYNIKRNLIIPQLNNSLIDIKKQYRLELDKYEHQHHHQQNCPKIKCNGVAPTNEEIELEFEHYEIEHRSRTPSPRKYLLTEKQCENPTRKFHVTQTENVRNLPEFQIKEKKGSPQKYLIKNEPNNLPPIPLPKQFLVSESISPEIVENHQNITDQSQSIPLSFHDDHDDYYRRSPSPYPSLLINVPRNSICNELQEVDEESKSPTPEIAEIVLQSYHNTCDYWNNTITIIPKHIRKIRSRTPDFAKNSKQLERKKSKSESEISNEFSHVYNTKFLNSLDGVDKRKLSNRSGKLRKRKTKDDNLSSSNDTAKTLTEAANLLKTVNHNKKNDGGDDEVGGPSTDRTNTTPEPFWLIFSGEYTKAMNKDWHGQHFCCWQCDESLTGQRYVLRDDHPYCVSCYESVFANACEKCSRIIGIDSKDLSYKDKHWHEACFLCTTCGESLVDKQFGSKGDRIYCGRCYDEQFASRCDGCHEIFRAGTKKMEYKTRQWHEKCFCCCVCKIPIGTQSFIPREQEIYCAKCYEEKFATRCIKCNKVITSGGVTYKNEPWHRECFTCTHCSKSLAGERFTSRDEKPYCAECFGELFAKRCFACNKPITGIGGTKFISFEDRHWHNDCFFCASCRTSLVGRGFITDQEDIICPECAKQKLM